MLLDIIYDILKGYLALVIIWAATLVTVLIILLKRKDVSMPEKVFWAVIIFIAPVIGLIFYLIFGLRGKKKLLPKTEKPPST
jgi:glucan phosphoethanolaminetransferase (alkaline phosphatase superfamily)